MTFGSGGGRRAAKDLDWKRALGSKLSGAVHATTLSVFRSRLLINDADEGCARTVERAVAAGLFPKKVLAIVDSTGVMGAAAVADTMSCPPGDRQIDRRGWWSPRRCRSGCGAEPRVSGGKAGIDWAEPGHDA